MPVNKAAAKKIDFGAYLPFAVALLGIASWLISDHYPPWTSFYNDFAAFLGLWILLVHCTTTIAVPIELPRGMLGLVAITTVPLMQAALGHIYFAGDGLIAAAYLCGFTLACSLGFILARQGGSSRLSLALAWTLLLATLLSACITIYQWLGLDHLGLWFSALPSNIRSSAHLDQPNQLATLLCMGIASIIYLHGKGRIGRLSASLFALLLIFGVQLTQSRTPWLGAIFLAAWWLLKRKSLLASTGWGIGVGLAFYGGLIFFWPGITETPLTPVAGQRPDLLTPGTHFLIWREMLTAITQQPWWGYGWNQVSVAHVLNARAHALPEMVSHSHNLLLDLLIWNGLPIGLLIITGLMWWLLPRIWHCRTLEGWFALLVIGFVGIHSLLEYPHEYAYFLLPVGLLIGMIEADQPKTKLLRVPRFGLWIASIATVCFMVLLWYEYRLVEADHQLMRFESRRIGQLRAEQSAPNLFLLTQLREDLRMGRSLAQENMAPEKLEWMRKVTYRYPYYSNLFRYALSLALNNRHEEASREFRRLYDLYGTVPYQDAKNTVNQLATTQYPTLQSWRLP